MKTNDKKEYITCDNCIKQRTIDDITGKGVYKIKNTHNGQIYIGSTLTSFKVRWRSHLSLLRNNKHYNTEMQAAYNNKKDVFSFHILYTGTDNNEIRNKEQIFIDKFKSYKKDIGYNKERYVDRRKRSDETKRRISESKIGFNSGCQNGFYGKTHTPEVRDKIRKARIGRKASDATKQNMSECKQIKVRINNIIYPSMKEASKILSINESTLSRWIKKGKKGYEVV